MSSLSSTANGFGILFNDGTANRLLIGQNTAGDEVVYVSQPGVDVTTATSSQLIFNSNQDIFKIVKKVPIQLVATASGGGGGFNSTSLAHGLGFIPSYVAFITLDNGLAGLSPAGTANIINPALTFSLIGGTIVLSTISLVSVDQTNVTFAQQLSNLVTNGSYSSSATVYLLQETFS